MSRSPFVAERVHPITGERIRFNAPTARRLAADLDHFDRLRDDLRRETRPRDEIERALARLTHGVCTVERAARAYMESGIAPNTARHVASFLRVAGGALAKRELDALDAGTLAGWVRGLEAEGRAPRSVLVEWRTLRSIARYAIERRWIARSPWGEWRPRVMGAAQARVQREAARDVGELARLVDAAAALDDERAARGRLPNLAAKVAVCALLGLRQGELSGLRWDDVDAAGGLVRIVRQAGDRPPKKRRMRLLRAPVELFALLGVWRAVLESRELYAAGGPVFPRGDSVPGALRAYGPRDECLRRETLRIVVQRAGLPEPARWTVHSLRDSFVTLEAEARGGDLRAVADRSGHASIGALLVYLRSRSREPTAPAFTLPPRAPRQLGR